MIAIETLAAEVRAMREAQRAYANDPTVLNLVAMERLETTVDAMVRGVLAAKTMTLSDKAAG